MEEMSGDVPLPPERGLVGIIYNIKSSSAHSVSDTAVPDAEAEFDSIDTVHAIRSALEAAGYKAVLLEADATLANTLPKSGISIAFNIAEGLRGRGREAEVPALCNLLGIPFTGSDEVALGISLDKAMCKRLVSTYGVRTPKFALIQEAADADCADLNFPVIVKPNAEGSSKGVSEHCVVKTRAELRDTAEKLLAAYGGTMLAEEYISGREFTVGIIGNGENTRVFPPMEIIFRKNTQGNFRVYSYGVKQDYKRYIDYKSPADISAETDALMRSAVKTVFNALGCVDFARADFRMDGEGNIYFIEINPLPGLAPGYSDFPMLAEFAGVPYGELVPSILQAALKRLGMGALSK
jgi:D-alanine-D-alanine ligase and related ATP-grasp enzymes